MKHTLLMYLTVLLTLIIHGNNYAQQKTAPYFKIGQSLENFKGHFNSFSKKCGSELRITGFKTSVETEYNIFEYSFNKNLSIIGQLNKSDNSIHAINVTLGGYKANETAIVNFMLIIGSFLDYTNPRLDRMKLLTDLKLSKDFDHNNFPTSIVRNGMEYTMLGDYQELSFIVSDPKD